MDGGGYHGTVQEKCSKIRCRRLRFLADSLTPRQQFMQASASAEDLKMSMGAPRGVVFKLDEICRRQMREDTLRTHMSAGTLPQRQCVTQQLKHQVKDA